jgi:hypothetical protein
VEFLVNRADMRDTRFEADGSAPEIDDGEALLAVDSFGLTTNNITYVLLGDAMHYWDFFPGPEGWGRMPVWGYAEVKASKTEGVEQGARVYGYLPSSSNLVVQPKRVDKHGFTDGAPHRAELPSAYQGYRATAADPIYDADRENEQIIFWPLFYTSFLIDDFLDDEDFFGAETIVCSSASSKTAIIAAYLLAQREGIEVIGLTSPGNKEFVEELGIYHSVVGYDEIQDLPGEVAAYVDFSGDGDIRRTVHEHYGDRLVHDAAVGVTHHEQLGANSADMPGVKPTMFFAPDRIRKRGSDWGTPELERKVAEAWHPFAAWSHGWLRVEPIGADDIEKAYTDLVDGKIDPREGHVVSL